MAMQPEKNFSRRPLRPPAPHRSAVSYSTSEALSVPGETSVKNKTERLIPVVEFSSRATPQPFLDPSVIQRRIQIEKLWKLDQQKASTPGVVSSTSSYAV